MQFSEKILNLTAKAEEALAPQFAQIERTAFANTVRVMDAFRTHRVDEAMFNPTSGYGYNDRGREALDSIGVSPEEQDSIIQTIHRCLRSE